MPRKGSSGARHSYERTRHHHGTQIEIEVGRNGYTVIQLVSKAGCEQGPFDPDQASPTHQEADREHRLFLFLALPLMRIFSLAAFAEAGELGLVFRRLDVRVIRDSQAQAGGGGPSRTPR